MNKILLLLALIGFMSLPTFAQDSLKLKTVEMVINSKTFRGVRGAEGQTIVIDKKGKIIKRLSGHKTIQDDVYGIEAVKTKGSATTYTCKAISDKSPHLQLVIVDREKRRIRIQPKNTTAGVLSYVEYFY